jgi:ArsR family transcriptional regulator, cadmium/lead-responsive transcriptional repressor
MVSSPLQRVGFALADPVRQSVLVALLDGAAFPADLALVVETSRTNLSNHLACLRGCGLVTATPHGRRLSYELASSSLAHALRDLLTLEAEVCCSVSDAPETTVAPKTVTPRTVAPKTVAPKTVAKEVTAKKTVATRTVAKGASSNGPVAKSASQAIRVTSRKVRV